MSDYIGRFAPSPSGELHFGSLVCALASYIDAKAHAGQWLLRIEDLDHEREQPNAARHIIECLSAFGLTSDQPVLYQSQRLELYHYWIKEWLSLGYAYYCSCSRQHIKSQGSYYTGFCRNRALHPTDATKHTFAIRLNLNTLLKKMPAYFFDLLHGVVEIDPDLQSEDFIIQRRDQVYAYNLAVVLDDIAQGVNVIVRGSDFLNITGRQLILYHLLNKTAPDYLHIPLVLENKEQKLSKQNHAQTLSLDPLMKNYYLYHALVFLGQEPPQMTIQKSQGKVQLGSLSSRDLLQWAIIHWNREKIPKKNYIYEIDHCYNKHMSI